MNPVICIIKGCENPVRNRGLCNACYQKAKLRVNQGVTTWNVLTDQGLALSVIPEKIRRRGKCHDDISEVRLLYRGPHKQEQYIQHLRRVRERLGL